MPESLAAVYIYIYIVGFNKIMQTWQSYVF